MRGGVDGNEDTPFVVVIDDNEDDRYLLRHVLRRAVPDATMVEYEAADLAIEDFADEARFRDRFGTGRVVVMLDINMPRMTGFEFLERVGAARRDDMKVVILSASDSPQDRECAARFPVVTDTLAKPLSKARLRELVVG